MFSTDEPCQTIRGVDRPIPPGYPGHPYALVEIGPQVRVLTIEYDRACANQPIPYSRFYFGAKTETPHQQPSIYDKREYAL